MAETEHAMWGIHAGRTGDADSLFLEKGPDSVKRRLRFISFFPIISFISAGICLCLMTWRAWPDVQTDFGREIYIAWQLIEGKHLYSDIAYFNGPLSPHINMLWLRIFGTGMSSLFLGNGIILILTVALLYFLLKQVTDRTTATISCLIFLGIFAFGQYFNDVGSYNYLAPYSHEMTHGMAISLTALYLLYLYLLHGRPFLLVGIGLLIGLLFLTKPEIFLSGAAAAGAGVFILPIQERRDRWTVLNRLLVVIGAALSSVVVAIILLSSSIGWARALSGIFCSWNVIFKFQVSQLPFYTALMGTDVPVQRIGQICSMLIAYGLVLAPAGIAFFLAKTIRINKCLLYGMTAAAVFVLALIKPDVWIDAARPYPVLLIAFIVLNFRSHKSNHRDSIRASDNFICLFFVFSTVLLLKIILNVRFLQYGFVLSMPATLAVVLAMAYWIPRRMANREFGKLLRISVMVLFGVIVLVQLTISWHNYRLKTASIGRGADLIWTDSRGPVVSEALHDIQRLVRPEQSLIVFPEGVMLNYLSRRTNPTPYTVFLPPEFLIFGEENIMASLFERPPDYIILMHKNSAEYGKRFFGQDYAVGIMDWISTNYQPVKLYGLYPFRGSGFGMLLLKRLNDS